MEVYHHEQKWTETSSLANKIGFNVLSPLTPTRFSDNNQNRPDILDIALAKGVALRLGGIRTFQRFNSDDCPVLLKLGFLTGDWSNPVKTITIWKKVSVALEEINNPALSVISKDIVSTDEIDHAKGILTTHVRTVIKKKPRKVPANIDHRKLPRDVLMMPRVKNAALRRVGACPAPFN
ncbi:hypothetical protein EVAR_69803_1 [Eumeta japonica]|uniref:Uncharacterized protein n=1 Tax=Eumeta variegata TaxID=151549 RepID=A0A4C1Z5J0_EUMVA|nr:hypothetical protein EVAR_69803_1 [Eumeta japonica]